MTEIRKTTIKPGYVVLHADGMIRLTLAEMQQLHAQLGEVLKGKEVQSLPLAAKRKVEK